MLTIRGAASTFCDGMSRREFLRVGAIGAGALGLTLADVLRLRAASGGAPGAAGARPRSAILIFLPGGPPHLDMYDPKPDAPKEYRGEFGAIGTSVDGLQLCELFPRQARLADRLAVLRGVVGSDGQHAAYQFMTGYPKRAMRPAFGSVVSHLRSGDESGVPTYVSLQRRNEEQPTWLGASHRPFEARGAGIADLSPAREVDTTRMRSRRDLLADFDTMRRDIDASGALEGVDRFTERAFDIVSSGAVREAFDLSREDPRVRERYGDREGERFLLARRLVEAGAGVVTLSYGGWDTHSGNFDRMRTQLPVLDRAFSALIEDLEQRGLLDDVAIGMWGEFGRTPKINGSAGRDHWPQVMSAVLAGGGLTTGCVVGETDPRGERAIDRPVSVEQLHATLYRAIGIDPETTLTDGAGRPVHLVDDRAPVPELS